jgi:hypothetical protein
MEKIFFREHNSFSKLEKELDISELDIFLKKDQQSDTFVLHIQDLNFKIKSPTTYDNKSITVYILSEEKHHRKEILSTSIKEGECSIFLPLKSKSDLLQSLDTNHKYCFEFEIQNNVLTSKSFNIHSQNVKNGSDLPAWLQTNFLKFIFSIQALPEDGVQSKVGSFGKFYFECPTGSDADWDVFVFDQKCRVWYSGKTLKLEDLHLGPYVVLFEVLSVVLPAKVEVKYKNQFWRSFSVSDFV